MTTSGEPLALRVESAFRKLSSTASDLNFSSDELGRLISQLDVALRKLNLGIPAWVVIRGGDDPEEGWYWSEQLGYDKIGGTWGIAVRTTTGSFHNPQQDAVESWLFNEGPRAIRLLAIEHIPALLEKLSSEADQAAKKIRIKLAEVQEVATVVKKAADEPPKRIIARGPEVLVARENKK